MSSIINNLFSDLNNLTKHNSLNDNNDMNRRIDGLYNGLSSPALNQGSKFKHYQSRIITNLEKKIQSENFKEGFTDASPNGNILTQQTDNLIRDNTVLTQDQQTLNNLKKEYSSTVNEYSNLIRKIKKKSTDYIERVNPNNPYLGKNVCLSNGPCGYVTEKGVFKLYSDKTIFNNTAGKNGCPDSEYIKIIGEGDVNMMGSTISSTPPLIVGTPMTSGQSCGNEGSTIVANRMISNPNISYVGCYADDVMNPRMTFIGGSPSSIQTANTSSSGSYTYDECETSAINGGYRYFALQAVDYSTSKGYCAATNDKTTATSLGKSFIVNKQIAVWSSKTTGVKKGSIAILNGDGTLVVNNTSGKTIFTSPVPKSVKSQPNPYIGCYKLDGNSKEYEIADRYTVTFDQCQDLATDKGYKYFGVGGNNRKDKVKQCFGYNDLLTAQQNGISKKCKNKITGGNDAASVYATDNNNTLGNCYLILKDNGNMCIYRGTNPSDNQGLIWSSKTKGKQQASNPMYVATKGKYGKNWITNQSTLAPGDFVGSTNGNMALIMQSDGNLVLYTFTRTSNCKKMANGNYGAGIGGNALYDIGKVGNLATLGLTGYIDQDSNLYTQNNIQDKSLEGFEISKDTSSNSLSGVSTVFTLDTNIFDNYEKTDNADLFEALKYANSTEKQQLAQLESTLNLIASRILDYNRNFSRGLLNAQSQAETNTDGIQYYLDNLNDINNKVKNFDTNYENILNDSDIIVLQKNYNYLFWSILAAGSVLIAMNINKK